MIWISTIPDFPDQLASRPSRPPFRTCVTHLSRPFRPFRRWRLWEGVGTGHDMHFRSQYTYITNTLRAAGRLIELGHTASPACCICYPSDLSYSDVFHIPHSGIKNGLEPGSLHHHPQNIVFKPLSCQTASLFSRKILLFDAVRFILYVVLECPLYLQMK